MLGAILGDIIGSPYEFDQDKDLVAGKDFPLFCARSQFTDDTVMTAAVAEGLMKGGGDRERCREEVIRAMRAWGARYPDAGYGARFGMWLFLEGGVPYNSFGNGSAMRVSPAAWLYDTLEEVLDFAALTAEVTHNHPEGIKGAQATAAAIFLGRTGHSKGEIRAYIESRFGYDLSRTIDQIRPTYHHVESCQRTVPEAITAFLEGEGFEDVIRTAVSLGGDADTLTAIAGSIAEGFYGVPGELAAEARARLPGDILAVLDRFEARRARRAGEAPVTQVVAALIWEGDRFMICQRPVHKARGLLWEFVGGKVEPGETREQALVRECREELAVTVAPGDIFMEVTHAYPDLTVHLTLFNAVLAEGTPQKLEHNDIRWITAAEIPDYDFCPADETILKRLQEQ